jgi:CubicO group peptidase (beta-lactamase class C family)
MKFSFFFIGLICWFDTFAQFETDITYRQLDSIIYGINPDTEAPGMGAIVIKDDSIVYFTTTGYANTKRKLPIGLHTQYNIGSITKMFTTTAILLLEEEGKLHRTDEIHQYIPELPAYPQPITINHLLGHTSGIRDHFEVASFLFNYNKKLVSFEGMLNYQNEFPELNTNTGESFAYSNTGYMLLALIIEKVSNQSYESYLAENIFKPLGMENSFATREKQKYLADGTTNYPQKTNGKFKGPFSYYDALGATGVYATLYDMYLWDKNFYNNKLGKQSQSLIDTLQHSFALNSGESVNYGCGIIEKKYRGKIAYEHSGGWGYYLTQYRRFPDEHISVIAWNNSDNYSPFTTVDKICNAIFKFDTTKTMSDMLPGFNQKTLEGIYITNNNLIREVKVKGDSLILRLPLQQSTRFHNLTYAGSFRDSIITYVDSLNNPVVFIKSAGRVVGFKWQGGEYFVANRYYSKIDENNIIPTKQLTGKYENGQQNKKVKISYKKYRHQLYLRNFIFYKMKMEHVCGNVYYLPEYQFYVRAESDKIILGDDWIFNLTYTKNK